MLIQWIALNNTGKWRDSNVLQTYRLHGFYDKKVGRFILIIKTMFLETWDFYRLFILTFGRLNIKW